MEITTVHVDFKATISNGNYGNETYTVAFTASLGEGEDAQPNLQDTVEYLAAKAREYVYGEMKRSPQDAIRFALETPEERAARYERERREADERYARERAERQARAAQEQASDDATHRPNRSKGARA